MAGKPWTEEEKRFIRENYLTKTCGEMADALGTRTGRAVEHCARAMGLERPEPKKGDKFGRWELLTDKYLVEQHGQQKGLVLAKCECGTERELVLTRLVAGKSQSCGCLKNEKASERMKKMNEKGLGTHVKHGLSRHPVYKLYHTMLNRCYYENQEYFHNYGGRGITVCNEWRDSFETFAAWAFSNGWEEGLTIERKNVNDGYTPDNCCFATWKEQGNNRRDNHFLTAFGETKTLMQWSEDNRCVVPYNTLRYRVAYYGWSSEEALTTPSIRNN